MRAARATTVGLGPLALPVTRGGLGRPLRGEVTDRGRRACDWVAARFRCAGLGGVKREASPSFEFRLGASAETAIPMRPDPVRANVISIHPRLLKALDGIDEVGMVGHFRRVAARGAAWSVVVLFLLIMPPVAADPDPDTSPATEESDSAAVPVAAFALTEQTLAPGETATNRLTLSNPSSRPVAVTDGRFVLPPHLRVLNSADVLTAATTTLPAGKVVTLPISVEVDEAFVDSKAVFSAITRSEAAGRVSEAPLVATLSISATDGSAPLAVTVIDLPTSMHDGQEVAATVQVQNLLTVPVRDVELMSLASEDVHVEFDCNDVPTCNGGGKTVTLAELAPHGHVLIRATYMVDSSVRTGTQQVGITFRGTPVGTGGRPYDGLVQSNVGLSIYGLDFLSPFGIAALVLIPGVVALTLFGSLVRLYPGGTAFAAFPDAKNPTALILVVPVSAAVLAIFVAVGRDIDDRAGTTDVVLLFLSGIFVGLVSWAIFALSFFMRIGRRQFKRHDSADKVLRRLDLRGESATRLKVSVGNRALAQLSSTSGAVWVCSPMRVAFGADGNATVAQSKFEAALALDDFGEMRGTLKSAGIVPAWSPTGVEPVVPNNATVTATTICLIKLEVP